MVKFSNRFEIARNTSPWKSSFINYKQLLDILDEDTNDIYNRQNPSSDAHRSYHLNNLYNLHHTGTTAKIQDRSPSCKVNTNIVTFVSSRNDHEATTSATKSTKSTKATKVTTPTPAATPAKPTKATNTTVTAVTAVTTPTIPAIPTNPAIPTIAAIATTTSSGPPTDTTQQSIPPSKPYDSTATVILTTHESRAQCSGGDIEEGFDEEQKQQSQPQQYGETQSIQCFTNNTKYNEHNLNDNSTQSSKNHNFGNDTITSSYRSHCVDTHQWANGLHPTTAKFLKLMERETEKVALFFLYEQGKIAEELSQAQKWFQKVVLASHDNDDDIDDIDDENEDSNNYNAYYKQSNDADHTININNFKNNGYDAVSNDHKRNQHSSVPQSNQSIISESQWDEIEKRYFNVGLNLLRLLRFVDMNVQAIRKLLKKHDKLLPRYKLSHHFLKKTTTINVNIDPRTAIAAATANTAISTSAQLSAFNSATNQQQQFQILLGGSTSVIHHQQHYDVARKKPTVCIATVTSRSNAVVQPLLHDESLGALVGALQFSIIDFKTSYQNYFRNHFDNYQEEIPSRHVLHNSSATTPLDMNITSLSFDGPSSSTTSIVPSSPSVSKRRGLVRHWSSGTVGVSNNKKRQELGIPLPPRLAPSSKSRSVSNILGNPSGFNSHQVYGNRITRPEYIMLQIHAAQKRLVTSKSIAYLLGLPFDVRFQKFDDKQEDSFLDLSTVDQETDIYQDTDDLLLELLMEKNDLQAVDGATDGIRVGGRTSRQQVSDYLNLISTFLFMTNYYIVAPTSASYAWKLGGNASLSGMIIGMTPVAALLSTILYSWWTITSYKQPLVFASTCSLFGNLCYALGLPMNSISLVMFGRLLNGFGSARSINRRYIADVFSKDQRTSAAAIFVTAGALGMSAGPAIASLLNELTVGSHSLYWQSENAPGTFMLVLWTIYLICVIALFEDPKKKTIDNSINISKTKTKSDKTTATTKLSTSPGTSANALSINKNNYVPPIPLSISTTSNMTESERTPLLARNHFVTSTNNDPMNTTASKSAFSDVKLFDVASTDQKDNEIVNSRSGNTNLMEDVFFGRKQISALLNLLIFFVIKLCQEAVLSAVSVLTGYYFGWTGTLMGLYLSLLGLIMLPVNILIAYLSQTYEDRELIVAMMVGMIIGCISTIHFFQETTRYTLTQYMIGSITVIVFATSLEGPSMSLLSKTIPKSWSTGLFNVGLLATEAGTLGRVVADMFLTWMGRGDDGMSHLLNRTFGAFTGASTVCLFAIFYFYEYLEPFDDDDD